MPNSTPPVRKLSNLILYSSLWIGACAASLVTFTYDVTGSGIGTDAYVGFVFCGTLALYAVHRLTGIGKVRLYKDKGRFAIIDKYKSHILIYGTLGALGGTWFLVHLPIDLVWWLLLPGFLSFMYVVPLGKGKRWRDYAFVKIFLVSGVWAALTGLIPFIYTGQAALNEGALLFIERMLFIFAIAIPFDIRDMRVDDSSGVKTLPQALGIQRAKFLAIGLLAFSAVLTWVLIRMQTYDSRLLFPYSICLLITGGLIWNSRTDMDDHYYSGLVDGTMFFVAFAYWIWTM